MNNLPLKNEEEEATKTHLIFCENVANKNPNIVNENNMSMIMETLHKIYNESLNNEEVKILCNNGKNHMKNLIGK